MSYLGDPTIVIIDWSPEGHGSITPFINPQYRLLEDHFIAGNYFYAGTVVNAGTEVPMNWIPTANVEPLNSTATTIFYNLGPRDLGLVRNQWQTISIPPPVTYWKETGPNVWQLTGLGTGKPPVGAIVFHPVGNVPQ